MDERVAKVLRYQLHKLEIPYLESKVRDAKEELGRLQRSLVEAYATRDAIVAVLPPEAPDTTRLHLLDDVQVAV